MPTRRPFHETVVDAILQASSVGYYHLAELLKKTKIPANHDAIIAACKRRCAELIWLDNSGVVENLLQQKKDAQEEKGISLDELQREVEGLLTLLKDRQGVTVWYEFTKERLENLHRLTSKALGK